MNWPNQIEVTVVMAQQDDNSLITKADAIATQALDFFDRSTSGTTPKQLAVESGLSLKTVYNRINQGQDMVQKQLVENAPKYLADIFKKYEWIWEEAKAQWVETKNVLYLKEMGSVLSAMRKMLSTDMPAKAPVNEKGQAVPQSLIMIFDDAGYKEKEATMAIEQANAIEGEFTTFGTDDETSTKVLLQPDENDL